jgi:hypothetical protein
MTFRQILSALNPLQYLPVIGTIYRAITGDQIPEALRTIGSIVVGALTGGPIGAAISAGIAVAQKITGIDLDEVGQTMLASMGVTHPPVASPDAAPGQLAGPVPSTAPDALPAPSAPPSMPAVALVPPATQPFQTPPPARQPVPPPPPAVSLIQPWSPAQLAAYGVRTGLDGALTLAGLSGADVLNSLEMSRIQVAQNAYGQAARLAA